VSIINKRTAKAARSIAISVVGFIIAILSNALIPQIAEGVTIEEYKVGGAAVTMNQAYRVLLAAIIVFFAARGIHASFDKARLERYGKASAFRFACGIALALWDLLGTKLLLLPQPFFPGPAGIVRAFLMESDFIWQNTLYSLRLFTAGFLLGLVFGVGTGIVIGWFPKLWYWVSPVLNITGVIPAVAWMPFALTLFPTPFAAAVFLIVISVWFPVASLTASGVKSTPKALFEVARTLGARTPYLVFRVAIPHAIPKFLPA